MSDGLREAEKEKRSVFKVSCYFEMKVSQEIVMEEEGPFRLPGQYWLTLLSHSGPDAGRVTFGHLHFITQKIVSQR